MSNHIYIFSGLGADESVFKKMDFSGLKITFIYWLIPNERESIENYATRILSQIKTEKPTLIGLSFGGIMAVEVAKQIETEKVILIASVKTKTEIPFYFRLVGKLNIHRLLPIILFKKSNFISNWFFGVKSTFDKELLQKILKDIDTTFLSWAIDRIVGWSNQTKLKNIKHIHGTSDRIFPICFIDCEFKVNTGGHFMTLNKAKQLTEIVRELL